LFVIIFKMAENSKKVSLPPIKRPAISKDKYAKSKLMTYRRSRERQKMLNNIVLVLVIVCVAIV